MFAIIPLPRRGRADGRVSRGDCDEAGGGLGLIRGVVVGVVGFGEGVEGALYFGGGGRGREVEDFVGRWIGRGRGGEGAGGVEVVMGRAYGEARF